MYVSDVIFKDSVMIHISGLVQDWYPQCIRNGDTAGLYLALDI